MTVRLAVFDCDGTLVDGQGSICKAMDVAFAAAGLAAPDRHAVRRIVGLSLPHAVQRLAPQLDTATVDQVVDAYKDAFRAARAAGELVEPLYDGIGELLEDLSAHGWLLGVATGKSDRGLSHCLAMHGIGEWFMTLQTADRHPSKPHPSMLETAMTDAMVGPADCVMIGT